PSSLFLGLESSPVALRGRRSSVSALAQLDDFAGPAGAEFRKAAAGPEPGDDLTAFVRRSLLDGYLTADWLQEAGRARDAAVPYPPTALARRLQLVAGLLKAGLGARVFYTLQPGYDTHRPPPPTHAPPL